MPAAGDLVYRRAFLEGLRPDPTLTVSQWAQMYRVVSQSSAEHGRWKNERTPYLVEIMDELSPSSDTEVVVFMKGAQIGGTECLLNWIGYCIDQAPGPILSVMPRVEDARKYSKNKIEPMIAANDRLRAKVREARAKDSGNSTFSKDFPGGPLMLTGANSAAGLRFASIRYLALDEVDAYPGDVEGEGDPVELARARTRTFARRKIALVSTPTIEGRSRIEKAFLDTDQRYYHVPCPYCGHMQRLIWLHLRYIEKDPNTVLYGCDKCGVGIEERWKRQMLANGKWIATNPEAKRGWVGFHLSSLYSPPGWFTWVQAAEQFIQANEKKDQNLLKTFINTVLGETWKEIGEAPPWQGLYARREKYPIGVIPRGGLVLTAGIDVQGDRIELEVVAWGRGLESWSVEYLVLPGKTTEPQVWADLDRVLAREWRHQGGGRLPLRMAAIDSNFAATIVYAWAIHHSVRQVMVIKGRDGLHLPVGQPTPVEVVASGKRRRRGVQLWPVGVSMLKHQLYGWLRHQVPEDGVYPPGFVHFPEYGREWFEQLTAESLVPKVRRGHKFTTSVEWTKTRERNEALDCRVYARAAAYVAGVDRYEDRHWDELEAHIGLAPKDPPPEDGPQAKAPTNPPPAGPAGGAGRRSGFLDRWRHPGR